MTTIEGDRLITEAALSDPDALPLTEDQLSKMVPIRVTRGRSKFANKKQLVSIRYSPEVVGYFKASGAGWQARIDLDWTGRPSSLLRRQRLPACHSGAALAALPKAELQ
jgi:hypothetical protein